MAEEKHTPVTIKARKVFKYAGIVIAVPVGLFVVLSLLFYFPPFQNWVVSKAAEVASEKMGMQISVGRVRLAFPLNLALEDVRAFKPNDSLRGKTDTVALVKRTVADVQLLPLFKNQVMVDELSMHDMKVNTTHFISDVRISGKVGELNIKAHGIDLSKEHVHVNHALLRDANLLVELSDTAKQDTAKSKNYWKINFDDLHIHSTSFALHTPGDTINVALRMEKGKANGVHLDLFKSLYVVRQLDWRGGWLAYDRRPTPVMTSGFDPNHIALSSLQLHADSFCFCAPTLKLNIVSAAFQEKSGLQIAGLQGSFRMDSNSIALPQLRLKTPSSDLLLAFRMDMDAFSTDLPADNTGAFSAVFHGSIGRDDLLALASSSLPETVAAKWPRVPLVVNGKVSGNPHRLHINNVYLALPGTLRVNADGFLANVTDLRSLCADIDVNAHTGDLAIVKAMLPHSVTANVNIPQGISLKGHVKYDNEKIASRFTASQGGGTIGGSVALDMTRMAYRADLKARRMPIAHFLRHQPIHPFTGTVTAQGSGTDLFSSHTMLHAKVNIKAFGYDKYNLDNIKLTAQLINGHLIANADCNNRALKGQLGIDALLAALHIGKNRTSAATLTADLTHVDLHALHLIDEPITLSVCGQVDIATDLNKYYKAQGILSDITVSNGKKQLRPNDVVLDMLTDYDTTRAVVDCNDFHLNLHASGGYERLTRAVTPFMNELQRQMKEKYIDQTRLRHRLPQLQLQLQTGEDNFVAQVLHHYGIDFHSIDMDITSSPTGGLNGTAQAYGLVVDSMALDTARLLLSSAQKDMTYSLEAHNGEKSSLPFHAFLDGAITEHGTWVKPRIYDAKGRLGVSLSLMAEMEPHGISMHIFGDKPILGYKEFAVNDSNYVFLSDDRRVSADMKLTADDGTGLQIFSDDSNTGALQDITASLHKLDIGRILAVIPYAPDITGVLDGDFHLTQTKEDITVSSSVNVEKMTYNGSVLGNVGSEFTYIPRPGGGHYVDGIITKDGEDLGSLEGTYYSVGKGVLDATLDMTRMPLDFINGFVPDGLFGFKGYAEGSLTLKGSASQPNINGELFLDSCYLFSEPYGMEVRFADDPVAIKDSHIVLENFEVFAHNSSPLNISGTIDFADLSRMMVNVRMRAHNYLLIDSKETARSEAYGKAYVNFNGTAQGLIDNLRVRGVVDVLGTTDVKYNLKDSPLNTDDQLKDLVEFTNFTDTTADIINQPPLTGLNVDLSLNIDEGAHMDCYLNASKTNYVDVIGGGELRMQYNNVDGVLLRGRYTINSGEMKYELPVIPLKTFTIAEGSYIQFTGDPMNPRLSITATETTKSTVGTTSGNGRVVDFTCGVKVSKTLQDMGLEFTIDAPEDMTIHDQLQSMTAEERGKQAVAMLTTGMYLAEGNTTGFSMNSALSTFLNSQINQISGKALRTLDIGFGVDNNITSTGQLQTDYSFKFARRFWNNRLKLSIGGKLSSGPEAAMKNETFFDNVSVEYRVSPVSNMYLNLFYIRDSYDWLEGNVSRFGGGFLWRKKMNSLGDLFRFRESKVLEPDTLKRKEGGAKE